MTNIGLPTQPPVSQKTKELIDKNSMLVVAPKYIIGIGTEKSLKESFNLNYKTAVRDNPAAQFLVRAMYYMGQGVEMDIQKASLLFSQTSL